MTDDERILWIRDGLVTWGDKRSVEALDSLVADLRAARTERDALLAAREPSASAKALAALARSRRLRLDVARSEAAALRARLEKAREALAARRFSHSSTCLGFIPAQRTPPDWSFSECSCGLSALAAALEGPPGPTKEEA